MSGSGHPFDGALGISIRRRPLPAGAYGLLSAIIDHGSLGRAIYQPGGRSRATPWLVRRGPDPAQDSSRRTPYGDYEPLSDRGWPMLDRAATEQGSRTCVRGRSMLTLFFQRGRWELHDARRPTRRCSPFVLGDAGARVLPPISHFDAGRSSPRVQHRRPRSTTPIGEPCTLRVAKGYRTMRWFHPKPFWPRPGAVICPALAGVLASRCRPSGRWSAWSFRSRCV